MGGPPWWQRRLIEAERKLDPHLRAALHDENIVLAAGLLQTVQHELAHRLERYSRRVLHLFNLPCGSDITRLLTHISSLERQVRELTKTIEGYEPSTAGQPRDTGKARDRV